jgi:two-component system sensor histidine kinase ChiS
VRKSIFCFCSATTLFVFISFYAAAQHAINGRADLSQHNFGGKSANVSGTWEFYWNELLTPQDFSLKRSHAFIKVPGSWHRQGNYPVLGCATYRVTILLPEKQSNLSLYLPIINTSAKIWVNGNLVEETGIVSCDAKTYKAKLVGTVVSLPAKVKDVEVIIQVANHSYFSGGIASVPKIDKATALFASMNRANGIENFFTGSLIAMFIYQLILYFLYDRGKPYLYLGLICLGVALRAMIVHGGSFLLPNIYPSVDWEYWKKIEFGCVYAIVSLFPLYVYHLFIDHAPRKPIQFFVIVSIVLCVTVLATPQYIYGKLLDVSHVGLLLAFIYAVYTIGSAWRAGNKDASVIMLGIISSFPFILAEILKNTKFFPVDIHFMYLVELGVLVFLLFQVYLLANHYAKAYRNLENLNQNLEKIVAERSGELITANTVKDKLLSVVSHDIKSPLNSLRSLLHVYNKGAINKEEFDTYTKHLEDDLGKTSMLVENLLYWTASQLKGIDVRNELFELFGLIEENIHLFNTLAANKKIALKHNVERQVTVNTDRNILNLVLRNVISNAIKFSFEGSVISITGEVAHGILKIVVEDQGVGMDQSTIEKLFSPELTVSSKGTSNEKGTGLGLALCHDYIVKAGGQLIVESTKGEGSKFIIILLQDNDRIDTND